MSNFRFSPTRPPVHWSGIRTAFAHGPVCPQSLPSEALEEEADALKKVCYVILIQGKELRLLRGCEKVPPTFG